MSDELDLSAASDVERSSDDDELPVVARMVVEIRSDGSRTVARGAVEDLLNEERVAVEARADSPLELSRALAKMLLSAPFAASAALRRKPRDIDAEVVGEGRERRGLRGRVRTLGRELGARVERELQARLRDDERS